jgi:DNA-binding beta-propeller fold protein YncE
VSNSVTSIPLGAGAFTPVAFLLSSDGQKVYTVVQNSGTILVYGLISGVSSSISLSGNPNPLSAALAPDGQTLYVGASDGKVHVVNTVSGGDVAQVDVPSSTLCTITTGGTQPNCLPDLLAVKP